MIPQLIKFFSLQPDVCYKIPVTYETKKTKYSPGGEFTDYVLQNTKEWQIVATTDEYYYLKRNEKEDGFYIHSKFCIVWKQDLDDFKIVMIDDIEHPVYMKTTYFTDKIIVKQLPIF